MTKSLADFRLCIAPMLHRTDRHFRYFIRLISKRVKLYTEMVTTGALLRGNRDRLLKFDPAEHPLAVQLGGSDPTQLRECVRVCEDYGYDEINLNIGCPSDRVQTGNFGACLMSSPDRVATCITAMQKETQMPITIKCRTGVDQCDRYEDLVNFVKVINQAGCKVFIIHARKAWLKGLSPKENRQIPPLNYATVHQLKRDFPSLTIVINGGFTNLKQVEEQLRHVDGVMIGRAAYSNPWMLADADKFLDANSGGVGTRLDILRELLNYCQREMEQGAKLYQIARHTLGLFRNQPGARLFRQWISENAHHKNAHIEVLDQAMKIMENQGDISSIS